MSREARWRQRSKSGMWLLREKAILDSPCPLEGLLSTQLPTFLCLGPPTNLQGAQAPLLGSGSCLGGCHVFRDPGPASSIFSTPPWPPPSLQIHLEMQQPFPDAQASSRCGLPGRVKGRKEGGSFCPQSERKFQYKRMLHQKSSNLAPSFTGKNICELRLGT